VKNESIIRRVAIAVNLIAVGWWIWTAIEVILGLWRGVCTFAGARLRGA
jgi:hypothetical protein